MVVAYRPMCAATLFLQIRILNNSICILHRQDQQGILRLLQIRQILILMVKFLRITLNIRMEIKIQTRTTLNILHIPSLTTLPTHQIIPCIQEARPMPTHQNLLATDLSLYILLISIRKHLTNTHKHLRISSQKILQMLIKAMCTLSIPYRRL
jgi:hypothetical protein